METFTFLTNSVEIGLWLEKLFLKKLVNAGTHKSQHSYTGLVSLGKQVQNGSAETSLELQVLRSQQKSVRTMLIALQKYTLPKVSMEVSSEA